MDLSNNNSRGALLGCLILPLISLGAWCQNGPKLATRRIDEQNGLSDNAVQCIFKDHRNFIWIGTASGLNEMNGSSITIFRKEPSNPSSLSNNDITAILPAAHGNLWIGTRGGLNLFDPLADTFHLVPLQQGANPAREIIQALATDTNGNLFIGTLEGLFWLRSGSRNVSPIPIPGLAPHDLLENNSITDLAMGPSGRLWISTYNGLWSYQTSNHEIHHEITAANDSDFDPLLTTVFADHSGNIWCGSWRSGLKFFNPGTSKVRTLNFPLNSQIGQIAEIRQPDGRYLLWFDGKNLAYDPASRHSVDLRNALDLASPITVLSIYVSADHWLWVGTDKGLYFYDLSNAPLRTMKFPSAITNQTVVLQEYNGRLLVGGSGGDFLKAYDSSLRQVADYGPLMPHKDISCLTLQPLKDNIFEAGTSEGIASVNLTTKKIHYDPLDFMRKKYTSGDFISCLFRDREGKWWIFPWRYGIWVADSNFHDMHQVYNNFLVENGDPKPLVVADAKEDAHGNLWMADLDEGIVLYDRKKNAFSKPFQKELGSKYQTAQILYAKSYCYSFTGNTVLQWNTDSTTIKKILLPPQMDKAVTSIALDSSGRLWIATLKGLLVFNSRTGMFERFSTADGLVSNNMDGSLYCMKNGRMVFGAPSYLLSFSPDEMIASVGRPPELQLVETAVNGKSIVFDTSREMTFNHTDNNFTFKWAVTDYNNPLSNHYYYQLQGIDQGWHFNGNRGEVNFANLSSGQYTLLLKGTNSNEVPAARILSLHFEIRAPFWRTWWFFTSGFLFLAGVFYLLYRYRLAQGLKLEKLRNKISFDLHDEIGSTLSSISILSEMALHQHGAIEKSGMLSEIKENSISLMERMDDIVWSINPKNDSMESLLLRIKAFAAQLFEAKEINYQIDMDETLKSIHIPMENRQHIYLIMKEGINNLVKYSVCTEAVVRVTLQGNLLQVVIKDNGRGFDKAAVALGNGIHSMEKRAADMHANLEIITAPGAGTLVTLSVKIK